jgi:tetratricopeptide (TPR) repeat protein
MLKCRVPVSPCPFGQGLARALCTCIAALLSTTAFATPRIPVNDSVVLEQIPAAAATRSLEPLRRRLGAQPQDLPSVVALAQGYLDIGRTTADPRFVSYAESTLSPWLKRANPSPAVLVLAAAVCQYLHRFDEALALLDRALLADPQNGQAWLTKATILQVQGHFDSALTACRPLVRTSGQLVALTCITSINSLTGKLDASYAALQRVFVDDPRLPTGVRVWIREELADMAARAGNIGAAKSYLLAALQVAPQDPYAKAAYADLLLREGRDAEVVKLLRQDEAQDNLLLRLALAGSRLPGMDGPRWSDAFQARYEAARRDGDFTHLREQARFVLEVRGDAHAALRLAARNWQAQREPADVSLYWQAASRAGDPQAIGEIRSWIHETGYEDRTLDTSAPRVPQGAQR